MADDMTPATPPDQLPLAALAGEIYALASAIDRLREDIAPLIHLPREWREWRELSAERVQDVLSSLTALEEQMARNTRTIDDHAQILIESNEWKRQLYHWTQRVTYAIHDLEKQVSAVAIVLDPLPQPPDLHERAAGGETGPRVMEPGGRVRKAG